MHLLNTVMAPPFIGHLVVFQTPSVGTGYHDTYIDKLVLDPYLHLQALRITAIAAACDLDRVIFFLYDCSGLKCLGDKSTHICHYKMAGWEAEMKGREEKRREQVR